MGVGNLGCCDPSGSKMFKGIPTGSEAGPSSLKPHADMNAFRRPSHAAVSLHPGSIKLKGSGSVSLLPDCRDNSIKIRQSVIASYFAFMQHLCHAPLEIARHISLEPRGCQRDR